MTPGDLYRTCRVSACRLEAQQHYLVPGDEDRQQAFHSGLPLPPARSSKLDDLRLVAELRQQGKRIGRIHIVDQPLSGYVQYELAVYPENVAAGEDIRIADRSLHHELADLDADFVVFDGGTPWASVVLFDYSPVGQVLGYEFVEDKDVADTYWRRYLSAQERSVSLEEFTAADLSC